MVVFYFGPRVLEERLAELEWTAMDREIKRAVFGHDKALGPDGYTSRFFKQPWDIVGQDVFAVVREFFDTGCHLKQLSWRL